MGSVALTPNDDSLLAAGNIVPLHDRIGIDNIAWECDYPHSDCTFPRAPEVLWESLKDLPAEEIEKMIGDYDALIIRSATKVTAATKSIPLKHMSARTTRLTWALSAPRRRPV